MEYTTEIEINAPVEKVANLLSSHEQMNKWIPEIESYKALSGKPATPNAKTLLIIKVGNSRIQITETILATDYPENIKVLYEMKEGSLLDHNRLKPLSKHVTLYTLHQEFTFKGALKLATLFMKPAFIKHSRKMMEDLKKLAEK